jgi:hypothetical protein
MGMRVGSGGGGAEMAQMQMAQRSAAQVAAPETVAKSAASVQNTQIQSVLSSLRGQGGSVDLMA